MKTFRKQLNNSLRNEAFKAIYDEERKLIELSLKIHEAREKSGLSQLEVAAKAHITQQQLSKVENGKNCNMMTFLKVCNALGLNFDFSNKPVADENMNKLAHI
jgi:HTH-type transcriptional regulator / antitoxin HipB